MDNFHFLIVYLMALQAFAKDFHYYCISFGEHLYADVVQDDLYDYIDQIKENVLLGSGELPYSSKRYLASAAVLTPTICENHVLNMTLLQSFIGLGQEIVSAMEGTTRGQNAILDEIAGHLDKAAGLAFLQCRKFEAEVQESAKVEHCKACIEKAVDRAKATLAKIDYDEVARTVLDYEAKNLLVAEEEEESTLDKLSKKLGV